MKIFVPFSEELFEHAGRQARSLGSAHGAEASGARSNPEGPDGVAVDEDDALGELVPFRLDYRCLRLKARPRDHAPHG